MKASSSSLFDWEQAQGAKSPEELRDAMNVKLLEQMKAGGYFFKHDFGRNKRERKFLKLSNDGLKLSWKSVEEGESTGGSSAHTSMSSMLRSASFARITSLTVSDVSHVRHRSSRRACPAPAVDHGPAASPPHVACSPLTDRLWSLLTNLCE